MLHINALAHTQYPSRRMRIMIRIAVSFVKVELMFADMHTHKVFRPMGTASDMDEEKNERMTETDRQTDRQKRTQAQSPHSLRTWFNALLSRCSSFHTVFNTVVEFTTLESIEESHLNFYLMFSENKY